MAKGRRSTNPGGATRSHVAHAGESTGYVALLRAVNLGGATQIDLGEMSGAMTRAGLTDVRSVLNSGNLVFRTGNREATTALEALLASLAEKVRGRPTDVFVRRGDELNGLIDGNPFPAEAKRDPGRLTVAFLREEPPSDIARTVSAATEGEETAAPFGRHLFVYFPNGQGHARLTPALLSRLVGGPTTSRNWNTILRLAGLTAGPV